jgi:hypothetical protein
LKAHRATRVVGRLYLTTNTATEGIQEDSANLKEKIILALSNEATIEDIQNGNL